MSDTMGEIAIKIEHVSKEYRLGAIGGGTLRGDLQSWMARLRGREDPNSKIGSDAAYHMGERFLALDDVSFEVKKGEALGIIGHNGAGKSTLLKLLSRVTAPTKGTIRYNGRIASMLEVGTGFHPELTGRENVYMNGAILGMTKAEIDRKFDQIVEFAEMEQFIDTPVKRYSSGMYVKLAFAVAAHLDSEIMVMDEVLAVGDMKFQQKCLGRMGDAANSEGRTVLYVSHNMNTIRQLCDRCIVLDKGKVIFEGDVEEAIQVYMKSESNKEVFADYSQFRRPEWLIEPRLKLLSAAFVGKQINQFQADEPLLLEMQWENLRSVTDVCLRMEILNMEGLPVATYVAYDLCGGAPREKVRVTLELDIGMLAEADYKMRYCFFVRDAAGNCANIDFAPGLCFTKVMLDAREKIVWDARQWGNVCMPAPVVRSQEKF